MLAATVALATLAALSAAQTGSVPAALDFEAPAACPDANAFLARVHSRTRRMRAPAASEPSWHFRVVIEAGSEPLTGRLFTVDPNGKHSWRELSAARCEDLADALALMVAIAVDPDAIARVPSPSATPAPPPAPPSALPPPARPPPSAAPPPPPSRPSAVALGLEASVLGDVAPSLMPAVGAFALAHLAHGSYGVSLMAGIPQSVHRQAGVARFAWLGGRLLGCPRYVSSLDGALKAAACLTFEAGVLSASGSDTPDAHSYRRPWLAPGIALNASWDATSAIELKLEGGASFPIRRDAFYFVPAESVHRPAVAGGWAALGISWRIP